MLVWHRQELSFLMEDCDMNLFGKKHVRSDGKEQTDSTAPPRQAPECQAELDKLISRLRQDPLMERPEVARKLIEIGGAAAERLISILSEPRSNDPSGYLQGSILQILCAIGLDAVDPLLRALRDPKLRDHALWVIFRMTEEITPADFVEPLIGMLGVPGEFTRSWAAGALQNLGDTRAIEPLSKALSREKHEHTRRSMQEALARLRGEKPPSTPLLDMALLESELRSADEYLQRRAADRLIAVGGQAIPLLVKVVIEGSSSSNQAAWALSRIAEKIDLSQPAVHEKLHPAIQYLARIVAESRTWSGSSGTQPSLARAVSTLGHIGDSSAMPALERWVTQMGRAAPYREYVSTETAAGWASSSDEMRMANDAVLQIKAREAGGKGDAQGLIEILGNKQIMAADVLVEATRMLVAIGERAVGPLIGALSNPDKRIRQEAAKTLGQLRDDRAVPHLIRALRDADVFASAAYSLGEIGHSDAIEPLAEALHSPGQRDTAVVALGKIGGEKAVGAIIPLLEDESEIVRERAAEALGRIGDRPALEPLSHASKDIERKVRLAARQAIRQIMDRSPHQ